jgi:competence protein ComEA
MPGNQLRLVDPTTSVPPWEELDEPLPIPVPGRHLDSRPSAFSEALVPQRWRGRFELGPWHVVVIVVAVCLALAAATWLTLRHQPHVVPTAAGGSVVPAAAVAAPSTKVTVDVEGTVRKPGIVVLRAGARVVDAVGAAGGPFRRDQLAGLNLATVLTDGQLVVVGGLATAGSGAGGAGTTEGLVNLNTASADDLDAIPGVGPVTAESIVAWRQHNGSFHTVDELLEVDGIGPGKFAKIKPHVTV